MKPESDMGIGTKTRVWLAMAMACPVLVLSLRADEVIGSHDWDLNPVVNNWSSQGGWTLAAEQATGGNPNNFLNIAFTNIVDEPGSYWFDTISTSATNVFAGTWTNNMWVTFDFMASNTEPRYVQVRWADPNTSRIWRYTVYDSDVSSLTLGQWTGFRANLFNYLDWRHIGPQYNAGNFINDLMSIDWIGVYIYRFGSDSQVYGIDNFRLWIPEPAEYAMVGTAVITSILSLRRRRKKDVPAGVEPGS